LILYLGDRAEAQQLTEWRLHIDTAWRLDGLGGPVVGSLDACCEGRPSEWVFKGLRALVGRAVDAVAVGSPVCELQMRFGDGYRLVTFAHCTRERDGWELRHRSGLRIVARTPTELVVYHADPDEDAEPAAAPDGGA
jgi:hypothetical protein